MYSTVIHKANTHAYKHTHTHIEGQENKQDTAEKSERSPPPPPPPPSPPLCFAKCLCRETIIWRDKMAAATFHNRFVLTAQRSYVKENKNQGYYNAGLMVDTCKALFVSKWMSLKLAVFRLGLYRLQRIQIPVSIFFFLPMRPRCVWPSRAALSHGNQ